MLTVFQLVASIVEGLQGARESGIAAHQQAIEHRGTRDFNLQRAAARLGEVAVNRQGAGTVDGRPPGKVWLF